MDSDEEAAAPRIHRVKNQVESAEQKQSEYRARGLTRDTRATVDGVLDPRSVQILGKFKRAGFYSQLYGCISTGKEANVYGATAEVLCDNDEKMKLCRAIKVFKTSILKFKRRQQYVEGEFRFRSGLAATSNPRKMVRQWAEKEFRNLRRLNAAAIRAPVPVEIRGHIFIMSLLGHSVDTAAPRLKDVVLESPSTWRRLYVEAITLTRALYQDCKLVHGDLSEYNLLYHQRHLYLIDVSQSLDTSHCRASNFLRRDCFNLTSFFNRKLFDDTERGADELSSADQGASSDTESHKSKEDSPSDDDDDDDDEEDEENKNPMYIRAIRHQDHQADKLTGPLHHALENMNCTLSVDELFEFIVTPSIGDFAAIEGPWPEYDSVYRQEQWQIQNTGKRIRSSKPMMQKVIRSKDGLSSDDDVDDGDEDEESPPEQQHPCISDSPFGEGKFVSWESHLERRKRFASNCLQAVAYVQATISARSQTVTADKKLDGASEGFMHSFEPRTLFELRDLQDVEANVKLGKSSRYAQLLLDRNESVSETSSRSATCSDIESPNPVGTKINAGQIPEGMPKKEWKKQVKEANRARRTTKLKKHLKKRAIATARR